MDNRRWWERVLNAIGWISPRQRKEEEAAREARAQRLKREALAAMNVREEAERAKLESLKELIRR